MTFFLILHSTIFIDHLRVMKIMVENMTFRCDCSAGCGRTGALCVIDYTWNLLQKQVGYFFFKTLLQLFIPTQRGSGAMTCLCRFSDNSSRFQHLWLSPRHENPEAFVGSNQGSYEEKKTNNSHKTPQAAQPHFRQFPGVNQSRLFGLPYMCLASGAKSPD